MAVTYSTEAKTARMDAIGTLVGNAGKIKGYTAADALVVTWTLPSPSAGAASNGVLTFDIDPDIAGTVAATGTITKATITTSADTVVVSGLTVGTSASDIIMSSNVVSNVGDTVTLQTATLTHV